MRSFFAQQYQTLFLAHFLLSLCLCVFLSLSFSLALFVVGSFLLFLRICYSFYLNKYLFICMCSLIFTYFFSLFLFSAQPSYTSQSSKVRVYMAVFFIQRSILYVYLFYPKIGRLSIMSTNLLGM